jgi:hypothetical protein
MARLRLELISALLCACAAAVPAASEAQDASSEPRDYSGSWRLDKHASDPIGPLLERQGYSWIRRKAADAMSITLVVEASESEVKESFDSTLVSRERLMLMDGEYRDAKDALGNPIRVRSFWNEEGSLVVEEQVTLPDGKPGLSRMTRQVASDGSGMTNLIELVVEGEATLRSRRVFQRER